MAVSVLVIIDALLWHAGLPLWRLSVIGGLQGVLIAQQALLSRVHRLPRSDMLFASRVGIVGMNAGAVALTGGLCSPLVPMLLGPIIGSLVLFGRSRRGVIVLAASLIAVVACGLLPAGWRGPRIDDVHFTLLCAVACVFTLARAWDSVLTLVDQYLKSESDLRRARESLLEDASARVRSLESIGARVGHELKNPLTAIKGLLPLLARTAVEGRARARFEVVEAEVARIETILREYLSFARPLDDFEPRPVALRPLVDEVLALLEGRAAAAGVALARSGEDPEVRGDPRRLRDALINLISNALEATPAGGSVDVTLSAGDGGAEIVIRDTGRGMRPEVLARVGTPFFTTREKGTGLGVVLARATIAQHGGELRYASEQDRGTTATIRLPYDVPARGALTRTGSL